MTKKIDEYGPIYGVQLIDTLPFSSGPMLQAMPSRDDLVRVRLRSERTVAGYEALLYHYHARGIEIVRLRSLIRNAIAGYLSIKELEEELGELTE